MSNSNEIRKPEELADDLVRRDAEWAKWEAEIVQLFVDLLQPILLANYPGSGWFRIRLEGVPYSDENSPWAGVRAAFGNEMKRLFAAVNLAYNHDNWQMNGGYSGYGSIDFNFRPLGASGGILERFSSIDPIAVTKKQLPRLPAQPSHARPTRRGIDSEVAGVLVKQRQTACQSTEEFIYEHFC